MAKTGRPRKLINKEMFENLCEIQCTQHEICTVLNVDDKTLTKWCKETYGMSFSETYAQKREGGKASVRRMQFLTAQDGNPTMQIWLGKQMLNQTDKTEEELEKIKADTEYVKAKTKLIKGVEKDTGLMESLIEALKKGE